MNTKDTVSWKPESSCLNLEETNSFLNFVYTNINKYQKFTIDMGKVEKFDPIFLGWLFLLKEGKLKDKTIELWFGKDLASIRKNGKILKIFWQMNQMVFYLSLFKVKWIEIYPAKGYKLEQLTVVSNDYFPPIAINEELYELMFHGKFQSILSEIKGNEKIKDELRKSLEDKKGHKQEYIYQTLKRVLYKIISPTNTNLRSSYSTLLYFLGALRRILYMRKFVDILLNSADWQGRPKKLRIPRLRISQEKDYEKDIKKFLENYIYPETTFYVLIFSFIVLQYFAFVEEEEESSITIYNKLKELCVFAKEYYKGIRELAKNVVEHSIHKRGIVLSRVYEKDKLDVLNKPHFKDYNGKLKNMEGIKRVFEIIILDDGEKGIIAKTIDNLEYLKSYFEKNKNYVSYIETDLENLKRDKFKLSHFYNPSNSGHFLKHQEIRTAASLGLLIFYQVIRKNKGYVYVSTVKKDGNGSESVVLYHDNEKLNSGIFSKGTYYDILLPAPSRQNFQKRQKGKIIEAHSATTLFESPAGSEAFNALAKGQIDTDKESLCIKKDAKVKAIDYTRFLPKDDTKYINKDKFMKNTEEIPKTVGKIITLNFNEINNASSLFRWLAFFQLERSFKSIILYNIKEDIIDNLIDILKIYHKAGLKIWSNEHFALFHVKNNFIPLILGGETLTDWYCLNKIVSKQHFLSNPFLEKIKEKGINNCDSAKLGVKSNPLFLKEVLIPSQVIISDEEITLFEQNTIFYLKQKIEEK